MSGIWLSQDVLTWTMTFDSDRVLPAEGRTRAYEHLRHAEELLARASGPMDLVDALTTLKRCMSQRLEHLWKYYQLDSLPLSGRPARKIDLLGTLGVVRPFFLRYLLGVRNAIEHADAPPPTVERCAELVDVVWYFLRSTDTLAASVPGRFILRHDGDRGIRSPYWIEIDTGPKRSWSVKLRGWVRPRHLSHQHIPGWLEVDVDWLESKIAHMRRVEREGTGGHPFPETLERLEATDYHLNGALKGPEAVIKRILDIYLKPF